MCTISIIVVSYNNEAYIALTLDSVLDQSYTDWECIIIDNGSTDRTSQIEIEYTHKHERLSAWRKANEGPSAGRNFGYQRISAHSKYVFFLDGDDLLDRDALLIMASYLDSHSDVVLLGCQFKRIDQSGEFIGDGYRSRWVPGRFLPRQLREDEHETPFVTFFSATGQGPFALFRRNAYEETMGYTESFWSHEDSDMFCQMALVGSVHYIPDRLYLKREHGRNLTKIGTSNYGEFRAKWDNYQSPDLNVQKTISRARSYYYRRHRPLRDFKIAIKAFREFASSGNLHSLRWSIECFRNGCVGCFRSGVPR